MFSVLLNTTQDISVTDQCSIVLPYVVDRTINERLISVKSCTDSTGKGMMDLLQSAIDMVGLDITHCIGNSTDGATNMRGAYNGFTFWLSDAAPEQVHVCATVMYSILSLVMQPKVQLQLLIFFL